MSGVYIPGMEMPKSCFQCQFRTKVDPDNLMCCISQKTFEDRFYHIEHRDQSCPLLHVPDHGDLIDREKMRDYWLCASWDCPNMDVGSEKDVFAVINAVPTIIPGEEATNAET